MRNPNTDRNSHTLRPCVWFVLGAGLALPRIGFGKSIVELPTFSFPTSDHAFSSQWAAIFGYNSTLAFVVLVIIEIHYYPVARVLKMVGARRVGK